MFDNLKQALGAKTPSSHASTSSSLPLYSPLSADTFEPSSASASASSSTDSLPLADSHATLRPAQRHADCSTQPTPSTSPRWPSRPSLSRFLADFTLGFADGLTVPFALTAGLSSLGQTDTVIYAGMAEICAGSISMGIGGYLSARGEARSAVAENNGAVSEGEEEEAFLGEKEVSTVDRYLAPLDLPPELLNLVRDHVDKSSTASVALERKLEPEKGEDDEDDAPRPVTSGMSVALGYLIGGSLPLFPYFIVSHVGDGLLWSFVVCIIALFAFGFTKDFMLHLHKGREEVWVMEKGTGRQRWRWADVLRSTWEGTQMVMLGTVAALAAVFCVRLFDGMGYGGPEP